MNKITEKLSTIFTEKQIKLLKDAWKYGAWGDAEVNFGKENNEWGVGACVSDIKQGSNFTGRQISGIVSGISKKLDSVKTDMIAYFHDWNGDKTNDMIFFNFRPFEFPNSYEFWKALDEWSNSDD